MLEILRDKVITMDGKEFIIKFYNPDNSCLIVTDGISEVKEVKLFQSGLEFSIRDYDCYKEKIFEMLRYRKKVGIKIFSTGGTEEFNIINIRRVETTVEVDIEGYESDEYEFVSYIMDSFAGIDSFSDPIYGSYGEILSLEKDDEEAFMKWLDKQIDTLGLFKFGVFKHGPVPSLTICEAITEDEFKVLENHFTNTLNEE